MVQTDDEIIYFPRQPDQNIFNNILPSSPPQDDPPDREV